MPSTADNGAYRAFEMGLHVLCVAISVHVFGWSRGHVYELYVQRSWYYFSTAGTCALLLSDLWRRISRAPRSALPPALSFGWCVLWIAHLGVDLTLERGRRYPSVMMACLLGLHVARAGLLYPLVLARQGIPRFASPRLLSGLHLNLKLAPTPVVRVALPDSKLQVLSDVFSAAPPRIDV